MASHTEFGKFRTFFWPIHSYELKKLVPMLLLFFLVSFNYQMLKMMKDAVVVTLPESGAEIILFIKVWMMLPAAIIATFLYTRLSTNFSRETVCYVMLGGFQIFFLLFSLVLYPNREALYSENLASFLHTVVPTGWSAFTNMVCHWPETGFYVMAELWSTVVVSVLFWGFANEITRMSEAKRFYAVFGLAANFSGILAGNVSLVFCAWDFDPTGSFASTRWEQTQLYLLGTVFVVTILIITLYRWMHTNVLNDSRFFVSKKGEKPRSSKTKMSMRDTFGFLANSKYCLNISLIVLFYFITNNLLEILWKDQVKQLYPDTSDFAAYMNRVSIWLGVLATVIALFFTSNSIRRWGWTATAMVTPIIVFIAGGGFFLLLFFKDSEFTKQLGLFFGVMNPLAMIVFMGSMQNCLNRACKYTVFDCTKELALIPLDIQQKIKAKAAIDGLGSRIGKAGGSVTIQALLIFCSTLAASVPYVAIILLLLTVAWLSITKKLGKRFKEINQASEALNATNEENLQAASSKLSTATEVAS
jgi:AAA family ATP:ADP antiporter